jgi:hypothetical protein
MSHKCRFGCESSLTARGIRHASAFQQGAGLVNASDALNSTVSGCANQGTSPVDAAQDAEVLSRIPKLRAAAAAQKGPELSGTKAKSAKTTAARIEP